MASVYSFLLVALTLWVTSSNMGNINSFLFKRNDDRGNLYQLNYTQKLEHHDYHNSGLDNFKFQQRLLVNDSQCAGARGWGWGWGWGWARRSPTIFAYFGGVDEELVDPSQVAALAYYAVEFKAMLISIEHRFNGGSIPLGSFELAMANHSIKASLSVENVLQDYADIIQSFKANHSIIQNSPVIVVGTGYGGALAAWFRQKYPHITVGAITIDTPKLLFHRIVYLDSPTNWCHVVSSNSKIVEQLFIECRVAAISKALNANEWSC